MQSPEEQILRKILRAAGGRRPGPLRLGIGDDAAVFAPRPGHQLLLTCDWFLEGTHFLRHKHPADAVGWKSVARATSDIAAMGGSPRCLLLCLALPRGATGRWLDGFLRGFGRAARRFACPLAGGDTTRAERILISVTVVGEAPSGTVLTRSGARTGDVVFVSGRLGAAEAGLRKLRRQSGPARPGDPALARHLYPEPRLALGRWLREERLASAMMDLSDGLSSDLPRLCAASGRGAQIVAERLPLFAGNVWRGTTRIERQRLALHGGDDYELLFTVPRKHRKRIPERFAGLELTAIGRITAKPGVTIVDRAGRESRLRAGGWDPFRGK